MAIQTQIITGRLSEPDGDPIKTGFVRFTLSKYEATDNGVIAASRKVEAPLQEDGSIALELWPNTAGLKGTTYIVELLDSVRRVVESYGRIHVGTDGPYSLADLILEELPPATTSYWTQLTEEEYNTKISEMETARDIATGARDTTIAARDAAQGHKNAAYGYAQDVASAIVYQNLAGVLASYNLNIVDAFVYDTTRDFMGGLWRYQTSGKSWFDEEGAATGRWLGVFDGSASARAAGGADGDYYLHSTYGDFYQLDPVASFIVTRGSRREFPANAIITAEANRVIIWDGDDPSLPMWMVFTAATKKMPYRAVTSVAAGGGRIITTGGLASGVSHIDLEKDDFFFDYVDGQYRYPNGTIEYRNTDQTFYLSDAGRKIVNSATNDVAMTVLPGAPIDPETSMPIPTIAVATDGGVSVIRDDGTVVSKSYYSAICKEVLLDGTSVYVNGVGPDAYNAVWRWDYETDVVQNYGGNGNLPGENFFGNTDKWSLAKSGDTLIGGDSRYRGFKLRFFHENKANPLTSMIAHAAYDYATGWMVGDIKGCWLASTDASDLVGVDYWENSPDVVEDWVDNGDGSYTLDGSQAGFSDLLESGVPAGPLVITFTVSGASAGYVRGKAAGVATTTGVTSNGTFAAYINNTTSANVGLEADPNFNGTVSDISVRLTDPDRSVNGKGLVVQGTIARTPVAPGAELMGYSGFSASNYLEQPYNPDLDFGTGDFCVMGWAKVSDTTVQYLLDRTDPTGATEGFGIALNPSDMLLTKNNNNVLSVPHGSAFNSWGFFCFSRNNGKTTGFINGASVGSIDDFNNYSILSGPLMVGRSAERRGSVAFYRGSIALLRIGATAPTPEQIAKIYRDEKKLFQPGAACTLYGDSDAVTALAHDDTKGLDLVGTSDGLSRFDGLLRVSHEATPITTTIACGAGYEVTQ